MKQSYHSTINSWLPTVLVITFATLVVSVIVWACCVATSQLGTQPQTPCSCAGRRHANEKTYVYPCECCPAAKCNPDPNLNLDKTIKVEREEFLRERGEEKERNAAKRQSSNQP